MTTVPSNWKENKRFCLIYPLVLAVEGGYLSPERAKRVGDKGGATNHGVAYNYHYMKLKQYGIYKPEDMVNLTKEQAIEFYYKYFWLPSDADEIPDAKLALIYWDLAVNSGLEKAEKMMSKLPRKDLMYLKGDGHNIRIFWFMSMYMLGMRLFFYTDLRQWPTFGKGWTRRIATLMTNIDKVDVGGYHAPTAP